MPSSRDDASWNDTTRVDRGDDRDTLFDPRTQLVENRDDYLGQGRNDVGRRIAVDQVELFISADLAGSLNQEFTRHKPEFIALHDLGTSASLRLLNSLAGAAGARVQRLSVRRQGHGVALAVLQFVEVPLADGTQVRVYSTEISADAAVRAQVARVLLAHSRLGVLMVGEMPPHALAGQLLPLHEALARGPWPNRDLLMVPLGSSITLAAPAAQLGGQTAIAVHVTPHAGKPRQAWTFIAGAWNRLHGGIKHEREVRTELAHAVAPSQVPASEANTEPMELDPGRARPAPAAQPRPTLQQSAMPVAGTANWQAYVDRCVLIKGSISCCVFDTHSMQPMAHAGALPAAERLAQTGTTLLAAMNDTSRALGLGAGRAEASISVAGHHLLLRPVPGHPGIAVHLVVSAHASNLTLTKMQLERIEPPR